MPSVVVELVIEVLAITVRQEERIRGIKGLHSETKISLYVDDIFSPCKIPLIHWYL